jgi:hypothetical protein
MALTPAELARIIDAAALADEARAKYREGLNGRDFVNQLMAGQQFIDTVKFMAHALPPREGVWWAWMCVRKAAGPEPPPPVKASLEATEKWLSQPSDELRRAAKQAADKADGTAAWCVGVAAFLSGGSVAPPDAPVVPAAEFASAKTVAGAVMISAVATEPEKAPQKYKTYIDQALDVANRIQLWEKPKEV